MFDPIARVLAFFYSLPVVGGSYGLAIILLTAAVMILLMPLTMKATRSTIKMQEVQPKLKELQKKYKDDRQTLNQELMALYQANGINPVGGCLPILAQLPVFLVLFNVLRGLSRRVSETPYFAIADHARIEVGGQALVGDTFDPKYLSHDSALYLDLSRDTRMAFGPFDLAQEALDVLQSDILHGIPYVFLILFVVGTSFYQQRQVSARRSGSSMGGMNAQQEMILKFLPLLSGIWSFVFPAGLVLYWATSNLFRIGQQAYITRAFYSHKDEESDGGGDDGGTAADVVAESPSSDGGPENGGSGGAASGGGRGSSKPKRSRGSSNGSTSDDDDEGRNGDEPETPRDREEAWARRRRDKAKVQAANKTQREQSSRVTPKGTKPTGSKKKRKR
jgi:YidC/Oxa1 family membrane protein insertase